MEIINSIESFRLARRKIHLDQSLGFVPTMGYLHEGHLSLINQASQENDKVVVSIFVNPTQFGEGEDFGEYPRDFNKDHELLQHTGCDIVFYPPTKEIYPPSDNIDTFVVPQKRATMLEGKIRPDHFKGVTTVVTKLLNIVLPTTTYLGQKDGQQVTIIKKMVRDLNFMTKIVVVPTKRDHDGLALSSRNTYLNSSNRQKAPIIYKALKSADHLYQIGETNSDILKNTIRSMLTELDIEYVSVADSDTLEELTHAKPGAMISVAVRLGNTRLIDNIILGQGS
jgi:pantoate--beta-alanine ligase